MTVVPAVQDHAVTTTVEVQVVSALSTTLARRRTPIVAVLTGADEGRPVAPTGSREEDAGTVPLAGDFVSFVTTIFAPSPRAIVNQFLTFILRRESPFATPIVSCSIVSRVA